MWCAHTGRIGTWLRVRTPLGRSKKRKSFLEYVTRRSARLAVCYLLIQLSVSIQFKFVRLQLFPWRLFVAVFTVSVLFKSSLVHRPRICHRGVNGRSTCVSALSRCFLTCSGLNLDCVIRAWTATYLNLLRSKFLTLVQETSRSAEFNELKQDSALLIGMRVRCVLYWMLNVHEDKNFWDLTLENVSSATSFGWSEIIYKTLRLS